MAANKENLLPTQPQVSVNLGGEDVMDKGSGAVPEGVFCAVCFTMRRITVSAHSTLCAVVTTIGRISVSAYIAL